MHEGSRIHRAESQLLDRAIEFLRVSYLRYSGTVDRARAGCPPPGRDSAGRPLQYFLAEREGRPLGVAGIGADGVIADWALERSPDARGAAWLLLDASEKQALAAGAKTIELLCPAGDAPPERELFAGGFRRVDAPVTSIRILDFVAFLSAMAPVAQRQLATRAPFTLHVHLERGDYPVLRRADVAVHVAPESTRVDAGEPARADAMATTTATALARFLSGATDGPAMDEAVTVVPPAHTSRVLAVLEAFRIRAPWFAPAAERR